MAATVLPLAQVRAPLIAQMHREVASVHAVRRACERGPQPITIRDLRLHEHLIEAGAAVRLKFNARSTLYAIEDLGGVYYAVWCRSLQAIVTYLGAPGDFRKGYRPSAAEAH